MTVLLGVLSLAVAAELPRGFVYLDQVEPEIRTEVRYATTENFVGAKVDGYEAKKIILTAAAADALKKVQADLEEQGLGLKVFDAYRPKRAVNHFVRWARDRRDTRTKEDYYPDLPKSALLGGGYISSRSRHSSGSTIDLTLVDADGKELDMGTPFDFFGTASAHTSQIPTPEQQKNRKTLKDAMSRGGFYSYHKEWWHYTLRNEPFRGRYFDFPVK
jgi:D-alanyl-D-alanine dipeptidase